MRIWFATCFALALALVLLVPAPGGLAAADDPRFVSYDEPAPEDHPGHHSNPEADLTYTYGWVEGDSLIIELDFASDWGDMHLMVILERNADATGGVLDPFEFPIKYGHVLKPDYVFTYKYSASDYADLRRWNAGAWEWWALQKRTWITDEADPGKNALGMVTKTAAKVRFAFPFDAIGDVAADDLLRVETYVTQEPNQIKYNALDSSPQDATNDMVPPTGDWTDTATDTTTLSVWAEWTIPEFGTPPVLLDAMADPDTARVGDDVLLSVDVSDVGGGIGQVTADLSALGGDPATALNDGGTGGDVTPSDGTYSTVFTVPETAGGGTYRIKISGRDASNFTSTSAFVSLRIQAEAEVFISAADSVGDDHGPNHTDSAGAPVAGLYYQYPTNRVFYPGVFDIEKAEFFIESRYLVARVYLGEVTSNSQVGWGAPNPAGTCTNPNKAQFNLQKIDILIDSDEGTGSTAGLVNRWADVAEVDAWEYAACVEGWWTGLVVSNSSDEVSGWTFKRTTADIDMCNDYVEDWVDVRMGLETLGLLAAGEDLTASKINQIQAEVKQWDFIIAVSGHDGDSNNNNQGATRVVNRDRSEWQFGGGRNTEGTRERDSNLIDILAIPGQDKVPGRTQEEMLDYTTDEAWARFDAGGVSCRLEAQAKYPGSISGTVTLSDAGDDSTVITVEAYDGDTVVSSGTTPPGGGAYKIRFLPDGVYDVAAAGHSYKEERVEGVTVSGGAVEGIDFSLLKVTGAVMGNVAVAGFPSDVEVTLFDASTGANAGTGPVTVAGGTGPYSILIVEDGTYLLQALAIGYAKFDSLITVSGGDTVYVDIPLEYTTATHYVFVDSTGARIYSERVTVSIPDSGLYTYQDLLFEPRDDDNIPAIADTAAYDSILVRATLLDPSVPARGDVVFAADDSGGVIIDSLITRDMFENGYGRFWVRDDSLEVLRIQVSKGDVSGFVELYVKELEPYSIRLTPDTTSIEVGGVEQIELGVQLLDDVGNPIPVADVGIRLSAIQGEPVFAPAVGYTNGNGYFKAYVYGLRAGEIVIEAESVSEKYPDLVSGTATVEFRPRAASQVSASLEPSAVDHGEEGRVILQVTDEFGNAVAAPGVSIDLSTYPAGLLDSLETPVVTGAAGAAEAYFRAGQKYGFATITGQTGGGLGYPVEQVTLAVAPATLIAADQAAPESDPNHNSDPNADLTNMYAWVAGDTMSVTLDFASSWSDMHLMVVLETKHDRDGGSQDPFEFPVMYGYIDKPDFVFTVKYTARDYGDLRRWSGTGWQYWQLANGNWTSDGNDPGKNAIGMVDFTSSQVVFKFPLAAIGGVAVGDTLSLEAYVTQEPFGTKYNALDSTPADATNDMIPNDGSGEWWKTATTPISLRNYAEFIVPDLGQVGNPPALSNAMATPESTYTGQTVKFSVDVRDSGGGIGDVYADLSSIGGESVTWLYDDGTGGDRVAGDNTYSADYLVPVNASQGIHNINLVARDSLNIAVSTAKARLRLMAEIEPFITVLDSIGDDHGPNNTDASGRPVDGRYYYYPTNGVFFPGVFDIERADFYIDGTWLRILVKVGDVPESRAVGWNAPNPGTSCTNPNKADFNLQKVDIYIDSEENQGATAGLTNRMHDIARSDAWEYAVAVEGWWKGFIRSNGQNSTAAWSISKVASDMNFCTDYVENTVEIKISLEALDLIDAGETMTDEVIDRVKRDVLQWDFIFTLSSHDGDSNDENQGAIRWVNKAVSEWQFGGGRDSEGGRDRDPNIIDVLTVPGLGKQPGRTQEEMMNYDDPVAVKRFEEGLMACVLEATFSEDVSPPIITPFSRYIYGHAPWAIMKYSPAAFWTTVVDDSDIEEVTFFWRPLGKTRWNSTEMVHIVGDYYVADIDPDTLFAEVPAVELVTGYEGLPFEAEIHARDEFGNEGKSEFITFGVVKERVPSVTFEDVQPGYTYITLDATIVTIPDTTLADGFDRFDLTVTPMSSTQDPMVDISNLRDSMRYLDIGRRIDIEAYGRSDTTALERLDNSVNIALHYPSYLRHRLSDDWIVGLFHFNDLTERWISIPGTRNAWGTAVAAEMSETGKFGLFTDTRLGYDTGKGLSSVGAEPNPFSPNGDGLYDETRFTAFVSREADWVTIEIYDVRGDLVRTIDWQAPGLAYGRNDISIIWDGRDDDGSIVPYGIYIARVEMRFKVAPNLERVNIPVVVIK